MHIKVKINTKKEGNILLRVKYRITGTSKSEYITISELRVNESWKAGKDIDKNTIWFLFVLFEVNYQK